jgi:hypothetical protein
LHQTSFRGRPALPGQLEGPIEVFNPGNTQLVADTRPSINAALFYIESLAAGAVC